MTKENPNTVTLETPVKSGGTDVTAVTLRKPKAGELRGLKLAEVMQMDADAMTLLLPRITTPILDPAVVAELDASDFAALAQKVMGFFLPKAQRDKIAAMQGSL